MSNPRSRRLWAAEMSGHGPRGIFWSANRHHPIPCELVALDGGIADLDYPPVGTEVKVEHLAYNPYTVKGPPFKDGYGNVWLPVTDCDGDVYCVPLSDIVWPPKPTTREVTIRVPADTDIEQALRDIQGVEVVSCDD